MPRCDRLTDSAPIADDVDIARGLSYQFTTPQAPSSPRSCELSRKVPCEQPLVKANVPVIEDLPPQDLAILEAGDFPSAAMADGTYPSNDRLCGAVGALPAEQRG